MINNINLYQFKRFKNEDIELFPLTLLTGVNGKGKSTVIQALLVLRQSFDRGELQNHSRIVLEDRDLINLVSPDAVLYSNPESSSVGITFEVDNGSFGKWFFNAEGESNTLPLSKTDFTKEIYETALFSKTFQYLNAERLGPRIDYERLTATRPHSPIGYRGEFVADRILKALTDNETCELGKLGEGQPIYELLSYWMSEILYPGTKVMVNLRGNQIEISYSFKEDQQKTFNPLNIGFGFSYALSVILALITAKPGSLLIIENPEAHLHPKGQSRIGMLMALVAESGVQIISETHSDHVLNGIRVIAKGKSQYGRITPDNVRVYFFHDTEEFEGHISNKRAISVHADGKLSDWPNGFFDEWENNLKKIIR